MLPIIKMLIDINYSKGVAIKPKYIVEHETDNYKKGATAVANRNYFANHPEAEASTHFVVDDKQTIQCLELYQKGWHVGDNKSHSDIFNSNSIGIEICVNEDGDYMKARQNAIDLTKYLMSVTGIPASNVVRHYDSSGKYCPRKMLDNPDLWTDFKAQIQGQAQDPAKEENPIVYGIVTASVLNVRDGAGTDYKILGTLQRGYTVKIDKRYSKGDWYSIYFGDHGGFVHKNYIKLK